MTITVINIAFAASIALSAVCLVLLLKRDETDERRCTMPSLFGIIPIANTAVWAFISSRTSDSLASESVFVIGLLLFFLLLGDVLSLSYIFNSVIFDDAGFVRRNFLGISRRYEYRDITEARKGRRTMTLFFGRKSSPFPRSSLFQITCLSTTWSAAMPDTTAAPIFPKKTTAAHSSAIK